MSDIEKIKKEQQKGHHKKAIEGYQKLLKKEPNNDEAYFGMALSYKELKRFKEALQQVKSAIKLAPNAERYLQFQGQMHMALGEMDDAMQAFKMSLKHNPNLYFSYLAIGDIYLIKGETKESEKNYRLALRVHQDAVPATLKLAKLLILTGRIDEAESELQTAALYQPKNPELKLHQGIVKLERGETGFAELHFKKLLEDYPDYPLVRANLAISLMDSDTKAAQKLISQLLEAKHQSPELMAAVGMLCLKNKQFDDAIQYLLSVSRTPIAYPSWLLALCQAWLSIGEIKVAKETLQHLLQRGHNDRAAIMLGKVYNRAQDFAQAAELFNDIEADSPFYRTALNQLQIAYFRLQQWDEAIATANKLQAIDNNNSDAILIKAHALVHLQQFDQALATLKVGLDNPELAEWHDDFHLQSGLIHDANQNFEDAWTHFTQQHRTSPDVVSLLNKEEEKIVQKWPTEPANNELIFAFSDTATGHHTFVDWLNQQDITPLIDRFSSSARSDLFSRQWRLEDIESLIKERRHLLRRKYRQHLNVIHKQGVCVDFLPFTVLNMALVKRVFPHAKVLLLDRNFADRQLHQQVFMNSQFKSSDFTAVKNQMIAMNPNIQLLDIDDLMANEKTLSSQLSELFKQPLNSYDAQIQSPLDQLLLPNGHWKNYRAHIQPS